MSFGQLYSSKICAALDRQHPRDFFGVKCLLNSEGLLLSILSNKRPVNELLFPNLLDQRKAMVD